VISIICQDCFDIEKHKGHDFHKITQSGEGVCDCGNSEYLNPDCFCDKHTGLKKDTLLLPAKINRFFETKYLHMIQAIFVKHLFNYLLFFFRPIIECLLADSYIQLLYKKAEKHFETIKMSFPDFSKFEKLTKAQKLEIKSFLMDEIIKQISFISTTLKFSDLIFSSKNLENNLKQLDELNQRELEKFQKNSQQKLPILNNISKKVFDPNIIEYSMRSRDIDVRERIKFITQKRLEFRSEKKVEQNVKADPKLDLKIQNLKNILKTELYLKSNEIDQNKLLIDSRILFDDMIKFINEYSQYIYLLVKLVTEPIHSNKMIFSVIKKLSFALFEVQFGIKFNLKNDSGPSISKFFKNHACILDYFPYLDVLIGKSHQFDSLNEILIDFSSDEDFSILFSKISFRHRLILNNFLKIEDSSSSTFIARLFTTSIKNSKNFFKSIQKDILWQLFTVTKLYIQILKDLNLPILFNKNVSQSELIQSPSKYSKFNQNTSIILIKETFIQNNYMETFFQHLNQMFKFYHPRNLICFLVKKINLTCLLDCLTMLDLFKYNISYWNHDISISSRQVIIVNWFKFHKSFFDFTKNIFLIYISYKEFINFDIKEILEIIPKYFEKIMNQEKSEQMSQMTLYEGDYDHLDLMTNFLIQFLSLITVYEFNKDYLNNDKQYKILVSEDIFEIYKSISFLKHQDHEFAIIKMFDIHQLNQNIKSKTVNFNKHFMKIENDTNVTSKVQLSLINFRFYSHALCGKGNEFEPLFE
jgi:hypothetical protein